MLWAHAAIRLRAQRPQHKTDHSPQNKPTVNIQRFTLSFGIEARTTKTRSRVYLVYTSLYHQTHSKLNQQPMHRLFGDPPEDTLISAVAEWESKE